MTKQGYEKLRCKLFIRAGLMIPDKPKDPKTLRESSQDQTSTKTSLDAHSEFRTKDECSKVKILVIFFFSPRIPSTHVDFYGEGVCRTFVFREQLWFVLNNRVIFNAFSIFTDILTMVA